MSNKNVGTNVTKTVVLDIPKEAYLILKKRSRR